MLELDDRRWSELEGGYRVPFDPRPALRQLERGVGLSDAWHEVVDLALGALAMARGLRNAGHLVVSCSEDELAEVIGEL